jgi:hypothetical protein
MGWEWLTTIFVTVLSPQLALLLLQCGYCGRRSNGDGSVRAIAMS